MSEFELTARLPLGGIDLDFDGMSLREVGDLSIVSIAIPLGGEKDLEKALADGFGIGLPAVGTSAVPENGTTRLLRLAQDQMFLLFDDDGSDPVTFVAGELGGKAWLTDQSDGWALLSVSGPKCRAALERICPLDLHPSAFPEGAVGRTVMEHLNTIVVREEADSFLLMSPRSSAGSFLHAVQGSIENIL